MPRPVDPITPAIPPELETVDETIGINAKPMSYGEEHMYGQRGYIDPNCAQCMNPNLKGIHTCRPRVARPEPSLQPFKLRVPHPQETAIIQRHRTIEAALDAQVHEGRWIHHVRFTDGNEGWVVLRTVRAFGEPFWEVLDVPPVSP